MAKTSLRERYKQADSEALALCNVYPCATSHLITMSYGRDRPEEAGATGGLRGLRKNTATRMAEENNRAPTGSG